VLISLNLKRCKYWDAIHPVFSDRTSSRPRFTADNLGDEDVTEDLLRGNGRSDGSDDDFPGRHRGVSMALEDRRATGKRSTRPESSDRIQKKTKLSLADAFLTANVAKDERARDSLDFARKKKSGMTRWRKKDCRERRGMRKRSASTS
jgi:hypothetical protein